jgi:predicted  nucleic acid-binding Zn-ribbon protein
VPERIPFSLRKAVIEAHLNGYGRNEIVSIVRRTVRKVAGGSVSSIVNEFEDEVNNTGLDAAAEVFGVSEQVQRLREVASLSREKKVELPEMVEGAHVAGALRENRIPIAEVSKYVVPVYGRLAKEGFSPDRVVSETVEWNTLTEKHRLPFDEMKARYEETAKRLTEATEEIGHLDDQIEAKTKQIGNLEKEYKVSLERAKSFASTRRGLLSFGLDVKDLEAAAICLENLKLQKFAPSKVVAMLKRIQGLEETISSLKGEVSTLEGEVRLRKKELSSTLVELKERKDDLDEARLLRESHLDIDTIKQVRATVELVARRRRLPPAEAMKRVSMDFLKNYDPLLGLEAEIKRLKAESEEAQKALKQSQEKKETQERLYTARKGQIEAYEGLLEKGIDARALLEWEDTISKSGLGRDHVTSELRRYSSLEKAREKIHQEVEADDKRKKILNSEVETLESERDQIIASIKTVSEEGIGTLKAHIDNFQTSVGRVEKQALGSLTATSSEVKANVKELEASVGATVSTVQGQLANLGKNVDDLLGKTLKTATDMRKLTQYQSLVKFLETGTGTRTEVFNASLAFLGSLTKWAQANLPLGSLVTTYADTLGRQIQDESKLSRV